MNSRAHVMLPLGIFSLCSMQTSTEINALVRNVHSFGSCPLQLMGPLTHEFHTSRLGLKSERVFYWWGANLPRGIDHVSEFPGSVLTARKNWEFPASWSREQKNKNKKMIQKLI
jgi:hypothetical protein